MHRIHITGPRFARLEAAALTLIWPWEATRSYLTGILWAKKNVKLWCGTNIIVQQVHSSVLATKLDSKSGQCLRAMTKIARETPDLRSSMVENLTRTFLD
jgi:hypothetical protein